MNADQIRTHPEKHGAQGEEVVYSIIAASYWLREIAAQIATLNTFLSGTISPEASVFNFHFHVQGLGEEQVRGLRQLIQSTGEKILMAVSDAEKALIKAFDDETNRIADAIAAIDKDDPEFNALLQAQVDKLKGVGKGGSVPQA